MYHKGYDVREHIEVRILPDRIEIVSHPGTDPERLSFCTTIFIHPQFLPSHEGRNEGRNGTKNEERKSLSAARTERILSAISENPHITMRSLVEELDIPRSAVERILKNLRDAGVVRHEGSTKKGRWVVL